MKTRPRLSTDPRETSQIGPRNTKDPRSVEYAWQTVALLRIEYQSEQALLEKYLATLAEAEHHEIYKRIPPEKPYGSLDALLRAELGVTLKESIQSKAQQAARDNPEPLLPERSNQHTAVDKNGKCQRHGGGNAAVYRVRRLRRDAPEVAARLEAGEFRSVAAAERAARGEEPHPPRKVPTPAEIIKRNWPKLSKAERRKLLAWLQSEQD